MRNWGIVLTVFYAIILLGVLVPLGLLSMGVFEKEGVSGFLKELGEAYADWFVLVVVIVLVASQALLLFLSVDIDRKKLKPQTNLWLSCAVASLLTAALFYGVVMCLGVAIVGDKFVDIAAPAPNVRLRVVGSWGFLWAAWGVIFYLYQRNKSDAVNRIVSWLLKGSVLELLVAVPCHVVVRRRHDCCAPVVTGFGIATGVAIMLLSFGPSVLFLYKKRLNGYTESKGKMGTAGER